MNDSAITDWDFDPPYLVVPVNDVITMRDNIKYLVEILEQGDGHGNQFDVTEALLEMTGEWINEVSADDSKD